MKFTYGTMLSPSPIKLSIGTLRKPTLKEISDEIGFDMYDNFEAFSKLTPKLFYTELMDDKEEGKAIWESFTDKQRETISLFNVVCANEDLLRDYINLFNFFFEEQVIFFEGIFVLIDKNTDVSDLDNIPTESIKGVITNKDQFQFVIEAIQQVCCTYDDSVQQSEKLVYKNSLAKELYKRMQESEEKQKKQKTPDKNFTIPNLISAVSNNHPTISPINVWELTVFQLVDSFKRRQVNKQDEMRSLNVSVWGDSDNKYNPNVWYKNDYDK